MKLHIVAPLVMLAGIVTHGFLAQAQSAAPSDVASQPALWGQEESGLRIGASLAKPATVGGPWRVQLKLENVGEKPALLKGGFAWVFCAQGRQNAFFSDRLPLAAQDTGELAAGKTLTLALELSDTKAFAYRSDLKVAEGYPKSDAAALGAMSEQLTVGKARARVMLYLPAVGGGVSLSSNTVAFTVGEPDLASLTGAARQRAVGDLVAAFAQDAVAAKAAHDRAVKIGQGLVPDLVAALEGTSPHHKTAAGKPGRLPWFGEMWLAATLADIGDARAVDALVATVKRGGAAAHVVAYHGWKLHDKTLAAAIEAAAAKDPLTAAWAARGAREFAKTPRADLVDAAVGALATADKDTRAKLVDGLQQLTGQKIGDDPAVWKAWWQAHRAEYGKGTRVAP